MQNHVNLSFDTIPNHDNPRAKTIQRKCANKPSQSSITLPVPSLSYQTSHASLDLANLLMQTFQIVQPCNLGQAYKELGLLFILVAVAILTFSSLVYFAEKVFYRQ